MIEERAPECLCPEPTYFPSLSGYECGFCGRLIALDSDPESPLTRPMHTTPDPVADAGGKAESASDPILGFYFPSVTVLRDGGFGLSTIVRSGDHLYEIEQEGA